MNKFIKINFLVIIVYFIYSLIYLANPIIKSLSIFVTLIYIFLILKKYGNSKKKNISFICFNIFLFICLLTTYRSSPHLLLYGLLLLYVWLLILGTMYEYAKGKVPYIVNNSFYSSFYNLLISDIRFNLISIISLLLIPIFLFLVFLFNIGNNVFIHILVFLSTIIPLFAINKFLNKKYQYIKQDSIKKIYDFIVTKNPKVVIYFSGGQKSTYQLNSWIPYLNTLKNKFIIIIRERHHISKIENTSYPILFLPTLKHVEQITKIESFKIALYTTNVGKNIHLIRDNQIKHVFIGHGDSDKSGSANNLMKLYDHMFVAGQAHIDRIKRKKIFVSDNYFLKIGRPQLSILNFKSNNKFTILYAPTWEGFYKDSCYSSLGILKNQIKNILNENVVDFHFKPHPLTGSVDNSYKKYSKEFKSLSSENHNILYKYLFDSDILIADISAILSDYLYFNKPIILFKPECIKDIEEECPISKCAYIIDYKTNLAEVIEKIKSDDYLLEKRNLMREYIMGHKNITFDQALEKVSNY